MPITQMVCHTGQVTSNESYLPCVGYSFYLLVKNVFMPVGNSERFSHDMAVRGHRRCRVEKRKGIRKTLQIVGLILILMPGCRSCCQSSKLRVEVETTYRHRDGSVTIKLGKEV